MRVLLIVALFAVLAFVMMPLVVLGIGCMNDQARRNHVDDCLKTHTPDECAKVFPP